ncbi:hypothetical protein GCM10010327_63490 [Streptomyces nitrosporeus]|nr:hypothetical protein GCM10010327_63490 [Streptomyces nitrosporeus]
MTRPPGAAVPAVPAASRSLRPDGRGIRTAGPGGWITGILTTSKPCPPTCPPGGRAPPETVPPPVPEAAPAPASDGAVVRTNSLTESGRTRLDAAPKRRVDITSPIFVYVNIDRFRKHSASTMSGVPLRPGRCPTPDQEEYP